MATTLNHVEMNFSSGLNALNRKKTQIVTRRHFETFGDFYEYIIDADEAGVEGFHDSSQREHKERQTESNWTLNASYADAKDLAVNGWPKGREMMEGKMSDALNSHAIPEIQPSWSTGEWGFFVDIGAYSAGDPMCVLHPDEQTSLTNNVVKLRVSLACAFGVDGEMKANWGTAIAFLILQLQGQGKQVAVEACYYTEKHAGCQRDLKKVGQNYLTTITLKQAGEPLDLDRVAYVVAHPAAHRRLIWRTREIEKTLKNGYGTPRPLPDTDEPNMINIEGVQFNQRHSLTVDAAIAEVTKIYNRQVGKLDALDMTEA
tara:strand:+ start:1281 stop:2228 length:948 start_codon:yes stop_codon:yes gene_type:complete